MRAKIKLLTIIKNLPSNRWFDFNNVAGGSMKMTRANFSARIKIWLEDGTIKKEMHGKYAKFYIDRDDKKDLISKLEFPNLIVLTRSWQLHNLFMNA